MYGLENERIQGEENGIIISLECLKFPITYESRSRTEKIR
jgi:hypothetical protein